MSESKEKRMIGNTGYEIKQSVHFGEYETLLAVNMAAPDGNFYMKADYRENGIIGEYSKVLYSSNYLDVMTEFIGSLNRQAEALKEKIGKADFQAKLITEGDCYPNDYTQSIDGKVVAIKAYELLPEYRRGDMQLVLVNGGNGAKAEPRGRTIFCYNLNDGSEARYYRSDVIGEIKELPVWAEGMLHKIQTEKEAKLYPKQAEPEKVSNYTIIDRVKVGKVSFVLGENLNAPSPYVTWRKHEGRSSYDLGHYFTTRAAAELDFKNRAMQERECNSPGRANKEKTRDDAR